jgi:hypothetical protein
MAVYLAVAAGLISHKSSRLVGKRNVGNPSGHIYSSICAITVHQLARSMKRIRFLKDIPYIKLFSVTDNYLLLLVCVKKVGVA